MKSFLSQFHISGMQKIRLEQFIYNLADQMIQGYNGGRWPAAKFGKVSCLTIPGNDATVTLSSPLSGVSVTTDRNTASVIFSFMVTAWFWERHSETMNDVISEAFSTVYNTIKDQVYSTDNKKIDSNAFFRFTD